MAQMITDRGEGISSKRNLKDLQQLQALPLSLKIKLTQQRIRQWIHEYGEDGVYVSFSGGKDSTVLLHLVRELYPAVPAVFVDVPTQYPELREFAKTFDNVEILHSKMNFMQVCERYGFPLISKEVSERVYYAHRYLTWWRRQHTLDRPTDRPTDRPHTVCGSFWGYRRRRVSLTIT